MVHMIRDIPCRILYCGLQAFSWCVFWQLVWVWYSRAPGWGTSQEGRQCLTTFRGTRTITRWWVETRQRKNWKDHSRVRTILYHSFLCCRIFLARNYAVSSKLGTLRKRSSDCWKGVLPYSLIRRSPKQHLTLIFLYSYDDYVSTDYLHLYEIAGMGMDCESHLWVHCYSW